MKRIFSTILAVLMLLSCMGAVAFADGDLTIISATAADGAQSVPVSALLTYTFSENIADIEAADVSLVVVGKTANLVKEVVVSGNVLYVRSSSKLSYGTDYSLDLTKVKSAADENKSLADGEITFKTKPGSKETVFEDNFESGALDSSWRANGNAVVKKENDGDNYSYKLDGSALMDNFVSYVSVFNLNNNVLIGFDMLFDEATADHQFINFVGHNSLNAKIYDEDGTATDNPDYKLFESNSILGYDKETGKLGVLFNQKTNATLPAAPIAGETVKMGWNKILIKADLVNQSIQLYVNGVKVKDENGNSDFLFPQKGGNATLAEVPLTLVRFAKFTNKGNFYVDNVYYREAQVSAPDGSVMTLTSSTPSNEKVIKQTQKEFVLTYNHEINAASLGTVTINDTAVKSAVASANTITVTIPDNYKLAENTAYTFDFVGAEDIYGCAIPTVTFRTKTNYKMYKIDFENGLASDDTTWNIRYPNSYAESTTMGVIQEPDNSDNKVFQYKKTSNDNIMLESRYFTNPAKGVKFNIHTNETVVGFSMNLKSMTGTTGVNMEYCNFMEFAYHDGTNNVSCTQGLRFIKADNNTFNIDFKNFDKGWFVDNPVNVKIGEWIDVLFEFNFEKMQYVVYVGETKCGPFSLPTANDKRMFGIDGLRFQAVGAQAIELYLDDIMVGQKFFGDTDYDMGFFDRNGEKTNVVDTEKTTYKVTAVNRGKTNDSTKLILVVTDVSENRMEEVRLIDFAEKNEKDEILISEDFTQNLEGKKIKAFYWKEFGSLAPVSAELRLPAAEVLPASAN